MWPNVLSMQVINKLYICFEMYKICDVIKQNEAELANIDLFSIANNNIQFPLCFIVLTNTKMAIYLWNRKSNLYEVFTKI